MGAVCFSDWGTSFIIGGGVPQGGIGFGRGGDFEKNCKVRGAPAPSMPLTTTMENRVDIELLLCMLSSVVHVLCMYVLFYKHY